MSTSEAESGQVAEKLMLEEEGISLYREIWHTGSNHGRVSWSVWEGESLIARCSSLAQAKATMRTAKTERAKRRAEELLKAFSEAEDKDVVYEGREG